MFTTFEIEQNAFLLRVTINEAMEFSQNYTPITGSTVNRMQNGTAVKQTHWEKLSTSIDCSGVIPAAFGAIDFKDQYLMRCGAKRSVSSSSANINVPSERRSDTGYEVTGYGYIEDGQGRGIWQETPVTMVVDVAQLTPIAGVSWYRAYYWPEITVFSEAPNESADVHGADYSWTLEAEQV